MVLGLNYVLQQFFGKHTRFVHPPFTPSTSQWLADNVALPVLKETLPDNRNQAAITFPFKMQSTKQIISI